MHIGQKHKQLCNRMSHQHVLLRLCLAHKDGLQVELQETTLNKQKHQITATSQPVHGSPHTIRKPGLTPHLILLQKAALSTKQKLCFHPHVRQSSRDQCSARQPNAQNTLRAKCCLPFLQQGRRQKAAVLAIDINAQAAAKSHISGTSSINLSQLLLSEVRYY